MRTKHLKVTAPAMKHRTGLKVPKTTLKVVYHERTIGVPWTEVRPLVACAFRHVQREAFKDHGTEFIRRNNTWTTELHLGKSSRGWWDS